MPTLRTLLCLLAVLLPASPALARSGPGGDGTLDAAPSFPPPGLPAAARAYQQGLTATRPPQPVRPAIEQALGEARAATAAGRPAEAIAAYARAIGQGDDGAETWLGLAGAWLARVPPDPERAAQAAWLAFEAASAGAERQHALGLLAQVLEGPLGRPREALATLQRLRLELGQDQALEDRIGALEQRIGLELRQVRVDVESEAPRICLVFSAELERRRGLRFEDLVRVEPAVALAADADGNALCLAGVSHGTRYRVTVLEGLPGKGGLTLKAARSHTVEVGDREPSVAFRSGPFILPRLGPGGVPVSTVNLDAVALALYRVNDRNLAPTLAAEELLAPVYRSAAEGLAERRGERLWSGRMEVRRERNRAVVTPIAVKTLLGGAPRPGLYVLTAEAADLPEGLRPEAQATQWLLISDLGLSAWRGADGIQLFARSLASARPSPGVAVSLVARNNAELARVTTDALGRARFEAALGRARGGNEPVLAMAYGPDGDFAVLDLTTAAFDLTDRGVGGRAAPGPLDAYLYADRGVYRPGETAHLSALLRDDRARAVEGFPLTLRVRRPNGTVYQAGVPAEAAPGAFTLALALTPTAPLGGWQVEALADPQGEPVGRLTFQVEDFVPERLAVRAEGSAPFLAPGEPFTLAVASRFLYGPPAAGLDGRVELTVRAAPDPYPMHPGFRFGLAQETVTARTEALALPASDPQGIARLPIVLPALPDTTRALEAELAVEVAEPGGRPSRERLVVPVRSQPFAIGIRPRFTGERLAEGASAELEVIAVEPDGRATARAGLDLELFAEHVDYLWYLRGGAYQYRTSLRSEPLRKAALAVGAERPALAEFGPLAAGRYRVEVTDPASGVATSVRFQVGWQVAPAPSDRPDRVEVTAERPSYRPGDTARVRIAPPFAGEALVTVATDRVLEARNVSVPPEGTTVELPVTEDWGAGAYVVASVYRPPVADRAHVPVRAIGLAWVALDPAPRSLAVAIDAPERVPPRQRLELPVTVTRADGSPAGEVWLTLAAVDEGILQLTDFASPDPAGHYLGKRRLGLDLRDDYGRLIDALSGPGGPLRQGGDAGGLGVSLPQVPITIVSLFQGPLATDPAGRTRVPVEVPDFNGELRLMAVAFDRTRVGAAARALTVRDPLVAELTLPRFLAPGDESQASLSLHNVEAPAGHYAVRLTGAGAVTVAGGELTVELGAGARETRVAPLAASAAGAGRVHLAIEGPGGLALERSLALTVRPARPLETTFSVQRLAPGATAGIEPALVAGYVPGTAAVRMTLGSRPPFDVAGLLDALERYPYGCLEQVVSRGLPLLAAGELDAALGRGRADASTLPGRLLAAIGQVLDKQNYAGAFGLWSAHGPDQPWLTAYAMELLARARARGHPVPDAPFREGLEWLRRHALDGGTEPESLASRAYALHVLALAGVATPGTARYLHDTFLERLPTPLARGQLAAALARLGDEERARTAARRAVEDLARDYWSADYGSTLRDAAAMLTVLGEVQLLGEGRLEALLDRLPQGAIHAADTSTQEQAWLVLAADALMAGGAPPRVRVDGTAASGRDPVVLAPSPAEIAVGALATNAGDTEIWQATSASGVPATPRPAVREGLAIQRQFLDRHGAPVDLDAVRQNDVLVVLLEGSAATGLAHQALVTHGLPAGWEIEAGPLGPAEAERWPWLGELSEPVAAEGRDDRFVAAVDLTPEEPAFRLAFRVRAVTPGRYELPGAELQDMYRPRFLARQAAGRIQVLPAAP